MTFKAVLEDLTQHNPRDVLAAIPSAMALKLGQHPTKEHPFAELLAPTPLRAAALASGLLLSPRRPDEPLAAIIGRGLRTQAFGDAIAAGLQDLARGKFNAQATYLDAVSEVEVTKLGLPQSVGGPLGQAVGGAIGEALDLSAGFADVTDGSEFTKAYGTLVSGERIELRSLGRIIGLTRQAVFNDDLNVIEEAVAFTGTGAARLEARLVAAALETTANLTDGQSVFDATLFGNVVTASFDAAGMSAAMAALRSQAAADGQALDAMATALIVSADLEYSARQLVYFAGLPIEVCVLPGLAAGRYYLLAATDVARTIAVARLAGQTHPLAVEVVRTPVEFDGILLRARIDTGSAMVGRSGIVRGGA